MPCLKTIKILYIYHDYKIQNIYKISSESLIDQELDSIDIYVLFIGFVYIMLYTSSQTKQSDYVAYINAYSNTFTWHRTNVNNIKV